MASDRVRRFFSPASVIIAILAGAILLSAVFFFFWQKLNLKVGIILEEQFNQQQLMLARKIADNVEAYFDYLENELLRYTHVFRKLKLQSLGLETAALGEEYQRLKDLGVLELHRYGAGGQLERVLPPSRSIAKEGRERLPAALQEWVENPKNQGHILLSKTAPWPYPPWQGRRVMRMLIPLWGPDGHLAGSLELLIDPFFICGQVTVDVRSGRTGYVWIIDQDVIFLAHYEKDFVGQEAMAVRLARNPHIVFRGLREINAKLLAGEEGVGDYDSGWHRQRRGLTPKLVAYTPIRFTRGLIQGVTDVEDPAHNLWGVAVVAPVAEVSGTVGEVMHQELFLVGTFFILVVLTSAVLIGIALTWNKTLTREVDLKTKELLESQERLMHSERFAAVGEAAAYVSHEIKNPLMVIGGLAQQVERRLEDPGTREKLKIIQNEVKRLEAFLGDLRDFTRPVLPVKQKIDLNQVIREVEEMMSEVARERGVTLGEKLDSVPFLEADPNQLKQVLVNLVKNALEATEEKGRILLATGFQDGQAWFSVQDTGKGMPQEVMDNIFHPFYTTKEKGTGLGLAVIHKIITDHHGTIKVDSAPGRGTTFLVKLPLS